MSRVQRIELLLFAACFFAFAYFNQGGGWNQNARFAEVRAMVEQGTFAIDDFLVFQRDEQRDDLLRLPVENAEYTLHGKRFHLCWVDMEWNLYPVGDRPPGEGVEKAPMVEMCSSGDVSFVDHTGHFHPNKPPGSSFLALPGYFVIFHVGKWLGLNPDHWWTMNLYAWLTTVCSVGLLSALGCVLFFRLARELAEGAALPALLATLTFAFGTTFFPFATLFFDHSLTASLLVGALYFLRRSAGSDYFLLFAGRLRTPAIDTHAFRFALAGLCAGFAAVTNYIAAVAVIFLGFYALLATPSQLARIGGVERMATPTQRAVHWRRAIFFSLGVAGPFLLICWYNWVCFGSPFRLNNDFQNPLFKDASGAFLGMFGLPNGYIAQLLIASPFRGIFYLAPVLLLGLAATIMWLFRNRHAAIGAGVLGVAFVLGVFAGWMALSQPPNQLALVVCSRLALVLALFGMFEMIRAFSGDDRAATGSLCFLIFGFFFFVNACFNGYHAGFSAGPRYLIPGIPFLALPLVAAYVRWRWVTAAFAAVSVAIHLLLTATDAQNPVGVGGHARVEGNRDEWRFPSNPWELFADFGLPSPVPRRGYNLLADYAWPLFAHGRAWAMLDEQLALYLEKESRRIEAETDDPAERAARIEELRAALRESIVRGEPSPFLLASVEGPVSVNPVGIYEGLFTYNFFPPRSRQSRWASFNVGEFFWPHSRWSLLPLLLVTGGLSAWALALAIRTDAARSAADARPA
jgi:hypothetical protein